GCGGGRLGRGAGRAGPTSICCRWRCGPRGSPPRGEPAPPPPPPAPRPWPAVRDDVDPEPVSGVAEGLHGGPARRPKDRWKGRERRERRGEQRGGDDEPWRD